MPLNDQQHVSFTDSLGLPRGGAHGIGAHGWRNVGLGHKARLFQRVSLLVLLLFASISMTPGPRLLSLAGSEQSGSQSSAEDLSDSAMVRHDSGRAFCRKVLRRSLCSQAIHSCFHSMSTPGTAQHFAIDSPGHRWANGLLAPMRC